MYPRVIACLTCRQEASRSQRRSTTSSTPVRVRWSAVRVATVSGRWASRTAWRSRPGISQSAGISCAASEVSPCSSGWFATLEGTSKTRQSCGPEGVLGWFGTFHGDRKLDLKGRALAGLAGDLHPAAVALDDLPHQVKADPGSHDIVELRVVDSVELLEQPGARGGGDTDAVVLHHQRDAPVLPVASDLE